MRASHLSLLLLPLLVASPLWLGGCAANPKANDASYDTLGKDPQRDTERAKTLNARAVPLIEKSACVHAGLPLSACTEKAVTAAVTELT